MNANSLSPKEATHRRKDMIRKPYKMRVKEGTSKTRPTYYTFEIPSNFFNTVYINADGSMTERDIQGNIVKETPSMFTILKGSQ
jgi:hypothetical protein